MAVTVRIDVEARVEWWRPLVQWVLCIPHLLYEVVLSGASVVLALVMGLIVATTGHVPEKLAAFQTTTLRERVRCYAYLFVLRSSLPPYVSRVSGMDPGDDPLVEVSATPSPRASRWSGITRPIAVLPHVVVLVPIAIVMDLCYPLGMLVVGANRGWPEGFAKFLVRIEKWAGALLAYVFLISDDAPHFGLAAYDEDAMRREPTRSPDAVAQKCLCDLKRSPRRQIRLVSLTLRCPRTSRPRNLLASPIPPALRGIDSLVSDGT